MNRFSWPENIRILRVVLVSLLVLIGFFGAGRAADTTDFQLGFASDTQWKQWRPVSFSDRAQTHYSFHPDTAAVCARAAGSASGLARKFPGKLTRYPRLRWEWKIERTLRGGDARKQAGDDYPARVYVNFERDGRLSYWERLKASAYETFYGGQIPGRSLNFIWANRLKEGEIVPSPYTEKARLVALRSGNRQAGSWQRETVNIEAAYTRAFPGETPPPVHSVAIMTDSDNTRETVGACYRNLQLLGPADK